MRNYKFNVVTPLARFENIPKLIEMLRPHNIKWHVITDEDNEKSNNISFNETWIYHYICPNNKVIFWDRCNHAMNWFLDTFPIEEDSMYCFLNDDDAYEPDYFNNLDRVISEDPNNRKVLICSMKRGDRMPDGLMFERQHPPTTLYAEEQNIRVGGVGLEQITVKGEILKRGHRFPLDQCGDGLFICDIAYKNHTILIRDLYILFNYFEPGRWNNVG